MSDLLVQEVTPAAAALTVAVADHDREEVARVLEQMDLTQLRALAVVLAAHVDPDRPFTQRPSVNGDPIGHAIRASALRWHVTTEDILGTSRRREHSDARAVACYVAHRLGITYSEIGRRMNRDHTTIMYSFSRVGEDARLRTAAEGILGELVLPTQEIAS